MGFGEAVQELVGVRHDAALVAGGAEVEVACFGAEAGVVAEPQAHERDHAPRVGLAAATARTHVGGAGSGSRSSRLWREVRESHSAPRSGERGGPSERTAGRARTSNLTRARDSREWHYMDEDPQGGLCWCASHSGDASTCVQTEADRARMPALKVANVSRRFGSVRALRDVSFAIEPGDVFGYLGPNGAGKTTTLRAVLGLIRPDAGSIEVLGLPATDPRGRRDVGFLPGELRLWNELSGRAVLDHFARYRPDRPPRLRAHVLAALDLDAATLARRVKFLSHGTRQKLGLAVAMQHDPKLLLLDEPSLGLDPLVQRAFRTLVMEFAERGSAVLLSSHILSEVDAVCSRVAIVRAGEIVAVERVDKLRSRVVRRLTASFRHGVPDGLGSTPGVEQVEVSGNTAEMMIRGDVNPLLRLLAAADAGA
jgi:ABC-2 type transport system ATP-binding protein